MYKYQTILLAVLLLTGCSSIKAVLAMTKSTDHFIALDENRAIHYEDGSEVYARKISRYLNDATKIVEARQYGAFPDAVEVYVPGSIDSFSSFCASKAPSACVIGGRLFMSPKLLDNNEDRIPAVLKHELSHLQLNQYLGTLRYQMNIPSWFAEGLAVYVSGGGGAEHVDEHQAKAAIRSGNRFFPDGSGSLLFQKTASSFDLKPHMFYRQASLYVAWLHDLNTAYFERFMQLLHQGNTVEEAMLGSFGVTVRSSWETFMEQIMQDNVIDSPKQATATAAVMCDHNPYAVNTAVKAIRREIAARV